jgi:hypothetical protein
MAGRSITIKKQIILMKKLLLPMAFAGLLLAACHHSTSSAASNTNPPASLTTADPSAPTPPAGSTAGPVMPNGPQMKFEYETHDFGKLKQGDKVTYKFNFANVGKSPLIITNATATCGCTTPVWPTAPIKPGEGGQITVTFNSIGKSGLQDKMITITANTNPPQNVVHLVGEVVVQ